MKLFFLFLLMTSCTTSQFEKWEVNGNKIICKKYTQKPCGLWLSDCIDQKTTDFQCIKSAKYLGPGDSFEPDTYYERNN